MASSVRQLSGALCCLHCGVVVRRYETTNHLWLILEYCVGGDLMSLLRQDVRLPESSIHDFGRDMVVALQVRQAGSSRRRERQQCSSLDLLVCCA